MKRSSYTTLRTATALRHRYTATPYPWWNRVTIRGTCTKGGA
jgi:hypothetical protein